ncbi:hypothetical protein FOCC_FOCC005304 [Frankliniella occidentalis]|nr:hypothetical protein FOCC_FOCC005304 [Frankliniella occidentalis]
MWNIPHCLGAIHGKQVYIKAFSHSGSRLFGYKKRHCITFMGVSNAKHQFLIVESGASGKRSDANIYYKSNFAAKLRRRNSTFLLLALSMGSPMIYLSSLLAIMRSENILKT